MPYCGSSPLKGKRPLIGITVPGDWTSANGRDWMATSLMERAAVLGFDFLSRPRHWKSLTRPPTLPLRHLSTLLRDVELVGCRER